MGLDRWFGRRKNSEPADKQPDEQLVPERNEMAERERGSIQAEMHFRFFNRPQNVKVGGDSLGEIADKVAKYVVELEMGPSDSVVSGFSIDIPGHPEIKDFPSLMRHTTKIE
ncbi:hypothetical protein A3C18_00605 [Candidatus Kaiserbacteria bacterium RIFCSPHIGHO2_02_FULL_54_11b]|uniref:Uncharacterized protein n=2 Tax=Candidatus Kaiseribacteriota TaxID=1752734 RepID=A0A1F6CMZ4_9BACT|nr:MAG: hypothetical protein A2704_05510 [Candidatus Kaiserbacteria bacterium RIFCSPHIGHO2_01_FULL_54_36b]OGG64745.1 MAG: hypothetical protein A3C18_00605 [Candidatus Kaiserbacteria bacterium RIFCSPHIGHO2_02_FULL_54_11b]